MKTFFLIALTLFTACAKKPTEPTPVPEPTPKVYDYGRFIWTGPFFATDASRYGVADTPGNVEVVADGSSAEPRIRKRMVIASPDDLLHLGHRSVDTVEVGRLLAVWTGVAGDGRFDVDAMAYARQVADARHVPVIVYFDGQENFHPLAKALLKPGDIAGIMGYPVNNEDASALVARVQSVANDLNWPNLALIRPLYTRGNQWTVDHILSLQLPLTNMIRNDRRFTMDLWFSWLRPSGAQDHPEFQEIGHLLEKAVP